MTARNERQQRQRTARGGIGGRWVRFNAVGLVGMGVQLGVLALLVRVMPGHVLVAAALALEVTLLHNFAWHLGYTWRGCVGSWRGALVRFHFTNGVVSLVGNLLLMRVLVGRLHVPVVGANAAAIAVCSTLNFGLSQVWTFAGGARRTGNKGDAKDAKDTLRSQRSAGCLQVNGPA